MTDRDYVLSFCRLLRLDPVKDNQLERPVACQFAVTPETIEIGSGDGIPGLFVEFEFDSTGSLVRYGIFN